LAVGGFADDSLLPVVGNYYRF